MEEKIAALLKKLSSVFRMLLWDRAKADRVTPIQIHFLTYVRSNHDACCTVSNLAEEFGLTKATVSRTVTTLTAKGFIVRKRSQRDNRVFILSLTPSGLNLAESLSGWTNIVKEHLKQIPEPAKEATIMTLMSLIDCLREAGVITTARMCISCGNFQRSVYPESIAPHYCTLTNKRIADKDITINCETYTEKSHRVPN